MLSGIEFVVLYIDLNLTLTVVHNAKYKLKYNVKAVYII